MTFTWYKDMAFVIDHMCRNMDSWYAETPTKIANIAPKDKTTWKWDTT